MNASEKKQLRAAMRLKLQAMSAEDRAARSEKICARVAANARWHAAANFLLFAPLASEPQIAPLETAALAAGKAVFIIPPTLRVEADLMLPFDPQLILVPGLAFSRDGRRLGRGGGFYDRLLAGRGAKAFKLGVCFSFQLHDAIPFEVHDALVDEIITD